MMQDTDPTIVVFRHDGDDVFALFPEVKADVNGRYCGCYAHLGQHSAADYTGCVADSRPASPAEYQDLKRELDGIGYLLDVRQRRRSWIRFPMQ